MNCASAVVLVVDRLGAGSLGPYGNAWLPTPQFNRLAARSLVCETVLADAPDLAGAYRAYWTARHALEPAGDPSLSLASFAGQRGIPALLVTDEPAVVELPLADDFSERILAPPPAEIRSAEDVEQTSLFHLLAAALEALARQQQPCLAWIHARGLAGAWDAPLDFRNALADPEDPPPPGLILPPERRLAGNHDPDEVLGVVQSHAGQVQLVDLCLGMLLDALDRLAGREELLVAVTSPRGYPLGEHGRIGPCDAALYSELLQVPLMIDLPRSAGRCVRSQQLAQPCDLVPTIVEACDWGPWPDSGFARSLLADLAGESLTARRELVCSTGPNQRVIRTAAWWLRESRVGDDIRRELFAKPDDRWEANEVSSRCGDIAELLAAQLEQFAQAARGSKLAELAPLAPALCEVWR